MSPYYIVEYNSNFKLPLDMFWIFISLSSMVRWISIISLLSSSTPELRDFLAFWNSSCHASFLSVLNTPHKKDRSGNSPSLSSGIYSQGLEPFLLVPKLHWLSTPGIWGFKKALYPWYSAPKVKLSTCNRFHHLLSSA